MQQPSPGSLIVTRVRNLPEPVVKEETIKPEDGSKKDCRHLARILWRKAKTGERARQP
jgi:hypothetical protein